MIFSPLIAFATATLIHDSQQKQSFLATNGLLKEAARQLGIQSGGDGSKYYNSFECTEDIKAFDQPLVTIDESLNEIIPIENNLELRIKELESKIGELTADNFASRFRKQKGNVMLLQVGDTPLSEELQAEINSFLYATQGKIPLVRWKERNFNSVVRKSPNSFLRKASEEKCIFFLVAQACPKYFYVPKAPGSDQEKDWMEMRKFVTFLKSKFLNDPNVTSLAKAREKVGAEDPYTEATSIDQAIYQIKKSKKT